MKAIRLLNQDDCCKGRRCPAIYEADNGDYIVVGKKPLETVELNDLGAIGDDEYLVIVPRNVLLTAKDKL